jgi:hypothetical protein
MASRKEGVPMGGGYYTDLKKFDSKKLSREMFILKKNNSGNFTILGSYTIANKKASKLNWSETPKTTSEERTKIAKIIDNYEKL